jgi:hypothetical protein
VRRLALSVIVALLAISASGLTSLTIAEPCTTGNAAEHHATCPPTCVTCGCCAQAAEPSALTLTSVPREIVIQVPAALPHLPQTFPHDVLHVPKPLFI